MTKRMHTSVARKVGNVVLSAVLVMGLSPMTSFAATASGQPEAQAQTQDSILEAIAQDSAARVQAYEETGDADYLTKGKLAKEAAAEDTSADLLDATAYPAKYDLRDTGKVTPVKYQNPFGSCWTFSISSAVETSMLSSLGTTYEAAKDTAEGTVTNAASQLSTKAMAWFAFEHPSEGSQQGEGAYLTTPGSDTAQESQKRLDAGGTSWFAVNMYASGSGPLAATYAPYTNSEGKWDEESQEGDWSVDSKYQYSHAANLLDANVLPAIKENNAEGVSAVKKALSAGMGVTIGIKADQSQPGQEASGMYMNNATFAHYCYDGSDADHEVSIVGWDDDYSASNFNAGHQPEGDGAWICKNSWDSSWGDKGYFYVSYYDTSIGDATCFSFDTAGTTNDLTAQQMDYLYAAAINASAADAESKAANVFTNSSGKALSVKQVGIVAGKAGDKVKVEVYTMAANADVAATLASATPVATQEATLENAGYHRITLDNAPIVAAGDKYVIVQTTQQADGKYELVIGTNANKTAAEEDPENITLYGVGVVNKGESFIYDGGAWKDWSEAGASAISEEETFDNFSIKAFTQEVTDPTPSKSFSDVPRDGSEWYVASVYRAADAGLIEGYDNGTFGPNNTLTRAQAATILWRYYDPTAANAYDSVKSTTANGTGMSDVQSYEWYTGAANWAVESGVISGKDQADGSKLFDPDGTITREQLCAIVANASQKFAGATVVGADRTKFSSMPDNGATDSWAVDSVAWGLNNGVISGKSDTYIAPLDSVTRAEMAAILMNSIDHNLLKKS